MGVVVNLDDGVKKATWNTQEDGLYQITLTDASGVAMDVTTPFKLRFFGASTKIKYDNCRAVSDSELYDVYYDGTEYHNCYVDADGLLWAKFENHPFCSGSLCVTQITITDNTQFDDTTCDIANVYKLPITMSKTGVTTTPINGVTIVVSSPIYKGVQGDKGKDGTTPEKGVDYFTEAEVEQVESSAAKRAVEAVTDKVYDKEQVDSKIKATEGKIPTRLSQLTNDKSYITLEAVISYAYSKSDTFTKSEVNALLSIIQGELDTLVGGDTSSAIDTFNEIKTFLASFTDTQDLASILLALKTEIVAMIPSLDGYLTTAIANQSFVSLDGYVAFTQANKDKLDGIESGAQVNPTKVSDLLNDSNFTTLLLVLEECYKKSETYTQAEVNNAISTKIAELVDGSPETLDTLKELADAITSNQELIDTLNAAIGLKLSKTEAAELYATIASLASVATSGSYNDLDDKPTLPAITTADNIADFNDYTGVGYYGVTTTSGGTTLNAPEEGYHNWGLEVILKSAIVVIQRATRLGDNDQLITYMRELNYVDSLYTSWQRVVDGQYMAEALATLNAVTYTAQSGKTDSEKTQARENIGAMSADTILNQLPYITDYDGTEEMVSGTMYKYVADAETILFSLADPAEGYIGIYGLIFETGDDVPTLNYPDTLTWADGVPTLLANMRYELNVLDGVIMIKESVL